VVGDDEFTFSHRERAGLWKVPASVWGSIVVEDHAESVFQGID